MSWAFASLLLAALNLPGGWSVLAVIVVWAIIVSAAVNGAQRRLKLERFCDRNQFSYVEDLKQIDQPGLIFNEGHSRLITAGLVSNHIGFREIANYRYTVGSGKNSQTYNYGFIRIKLPRKLPNMVLDAKSNNTFGRFSNLPDTFSSGQRLKLEGSFDKYFNLYVPKGYETDALYIFTPDVMQAVVYLGAKYDMEVIGDDLYVYSSHKFKLTDAGRLKKLIDLAAKLQAEFDEQADYYADERVGNRSANVVAPAGQHLKTSFSWFGIVLVAGYIVLRIILAISR